MFLLWDKMRTKKCCLVKIAKWWVSKILKKIWCEGSNMKRIWSEGSKLDVRGDFTRQSKENSKKEKSNQGKSKAPERARQLGLGCFGMKVCNFFV